MLTYMLDLMNSAPLVLIGGGALVCMSLAYYGGRKLKETGRTQLAAGDEPDASHSDYGGYIVSAVLGLLALLLGFTFSLAIDRFEERRQLVIADSNAIATAYFRAQLLSSPHRERLSRLLVEYTDSEIAIADRDYLEARGLHDMQNRLLADFGAASAAAIDSVRTIQLGQTLTEAANNLFSLNAARREAHETRVPAEVFLALWFYLIGAAGVLGHEIGTARGRFAAGFVLVLMTLSLVLIIDIDRPASGGILETQEPMLRLRQTLAREPPLAFDRWREPSRLRRQALN
jgi:hypothetical protein